MTSYNTYPPIPSAPPEALGPCLVEALPSPLTALGATSMTGVIASGIIVVLTKKYQQKLKKVTRLIGIITPALVIFERVVPGALKNGVIDEEEFNTLQALHLGRLNELTGIDHRMEVEHRSLV